MSELPADLLDWVESAASTRVVSARRHLAGASREAWSIDSERGGLFLLCDQLAGLGRLGP